MNIAEYKQIMKQPLRPRTLTFLVRDTQVLLGWKKTGFGKDYLLGIGGKVESGETIEAAAKREVAEEIQVVLPDLQNVGVLDFYFPHIEDESWNQQVHVFMTTSWEGTPQESEEIQPAWFEQQQVPAIVCGMMPATGSPTSSPASASKEHFSSTGNSKSPTTTSPRFAEMAFFRESTL